MLIYPNVQRMETAVSLTGYTSQQLLDTTAQKTDTPPPSRWSDRYTDKNGMSITFKQVFKNFKENLKSADVFKIRSRPQSKEERIADALSKTEKLLLSNDNARPLSNLRNKYESDIHISSTGLHRHILDEKVTQIFSPTEHIKEIQHENNVESNTQDGTNNAFENQSDCSIPALNLVTCRKGKIKKPKKHSKTDHKARRTRPGRISVPSTVIHHDPSKRGSTSLDVNTAAKSKPRISSEPISVKHPQPNVLSYTLQVSSNSRLTNESVPAQTDNAKGEQGEKPIVSTQYTHSSVNTNSSTHAHKHVQPLDALSFQKQSFATQKIELSKRTKSGHSIRSGHSIISEALSLNASSLAEKPSSPVSAANLFISTDKSCKSLQTNTENLISMTYKSPVSQKDSQPSKEATLTAIYGPQNIIPQRALSHTDDFRKVKKIYFSEKQSGTMKESGMEFPCAPPATPTPDVMRRYEYIPCMNDIRSQRAVKNKLQVMEREAQKKREKQKEANAKLEKQQSKDKEKALKIKQRREIYALNKIMTELEHRRFLEFCHSKGLNT